MRVESLFAAGEAKSDNGVIDVTQIRVPRLRQDGPDGCHLVDLANHPAGRVEVVNRHVGEESACARHVLDAGRTLVAKRGAEKVDVAQLTRPDPRGRSHPVRVEAAVETHLQFDARIGRRLDGPDGRLDFQRDRFLAEDVLSRLGCFLEHLGVERRGRNQHDALDLRVSQKVLVARRPLDSEFPARGPRGLL